MVAEYINRLQFHALPSENRSLPQDDALLLLVKAIQQTKIDPRNVISPTKDIDTVWMEPETVKIDDLTPTEWDKEWDLMEKRLKQDLQYDS